MRQLQAEYAYLKNRLARLLQVGQTEEERAGRVALVNRLRSLKMKRNWRFIHSVHSNYAPEKSLREVRSQYKKFREGQKTDIDEVAWRNPSP